MMRLLRRNTVPPPGEVRAYLDAPAPDPRLPWRAVPFAVLDVETSGLNPAKDELLAIGVAIVDAGRIRLDQCWESLVRPPSGARVGVEAIRVHGLLPDDTAQAPPIGELLPALLDHLRGRVLVVHVASIDIGFLNRAMRSAYGVSLRGPAIDTARIAATFHREDTLIGEARGGPPSIQLAALCAQHGLPMHAEHDALGDALSTAQLFLAQASRLEQQGRPTLRHLLRAGQCLR